MVYTLKKMLVFAKQEGFTNSKLLFVRLLRPAEHKLENLEVPID